MSGFIEEGARGNLRFSASLTPLKIECIHFRIKMNKDKTKWVALVGLLRIPIYQFI